MIKLQKLQLTKYNSLQIYQFLRYGSFFLISILLAKIAFFKFNPGFGTANIISRYELLMVVSSSLTFFWVSSICNTLVPFFYASNDDKQKRILFNAFALMVAFSILAAIATLCIGYFFYRDDFYLFQMFSLVVFLNTPTFIVDYIFYLKGKYKSLILWGIITFSVHLLMLCLPLYFKQTLNLAVNLLVILALLKFNYTIILLLKYSTISINTRLIQEFMIKVMPFMFSILLGGSMEYINSYIVKYNFTEIDFAVFRYGAKELPIFLIMANSLSNIYSGEIANLNKEGLLKEGLTKLKNSSRKLMYWLFPLAIVLLFTSKYMYIGLYNSDLVEGYKIFNISLLLIVSRLIFPQTVLTGLIKTRAFYLVSTNVLIVNVIMAIWLVQLFGITGIAYATVISFLVEKIQLVIYCKMEGIRFKEYTPVVEYYLFSALLLVAFVLSINF
jgi:O-antigen/teichoic acid export membrane protein